MKSNNLTLCALLLCVTTLLLGGCGTTRELAMAATGRPYVPTEEDRAKLPANPDFKLLPPKPGKAVIYVYRNSQFYGSLQDRELFLNDRSHGRVGNGQYRRIDLEPGEYKVRVQFATFSAQSAPVEGVLQLQPDATLVLKMNLGATQIATIRRYVGQVPKDETGLWMSRFHLERMGEESGIFDMARLRPCENSRRRPFGGAVALGPSKLTQFTQ
jgi:Protein of unknown function (DUF2846)